MEEWKIIENTNGRYSISSCGRVYDHKKDQDVPVMWNGGFLCCNIVYNDGKVLDKVHRLVAIHFVPKTNEYDYFVRHKDQDRSNNIYDNIEWYSNTFMGVGIHPPRKGVNLEDERAASRWKNMIQRCYDVNSKWYCNYGGRGVRVCEDFLNFERFQRWFIESVRIYDNRNEKMLEVDKDILFPGNKEYSADKCILIPKFLNGVFRGQNKTVRDNFNGKDLQKINRYLNGYGDVCDIRLRVLLENIVNNSKHTC